jgi:hypothetical protein
MQLFFTISNSVGATGRNKPVDVMIVQCLLNLNYKILDYLTPITEILSDAMIQAIKRFQQYALGMKKPDARVSPGGATWGMLAQLAGDHLDFVRKPCDLLRPVVGASDKARVPTRYHEASSSLSNIQPSTFLKLYDLQFDMLGAPRRAGLTKLIKFINNDYEIRDVGWCAYMLATVKYECKDKWEPIREPGRGVWHRYGRPDPFTDTDDKTYANTYYGRGYIPLIGLDSYLEIGEAVGLGDELAKKPDDALDPRIAYKVLCNAMSRGYPPGVNGLYTYINATRCDYLGARQIIMGHDRWGVVTAQNTVASYAEDVEMLLRVSCNRSFSDSPYQRWLLNGVLPIYRVIR